MHAGSLPWRAKLKRIFLRRKRGREINLAALEREVDESTRLSAALPRPRFDGQNQLQRRATVRILRCPNPATVVLDD
jgi:hypothetical protein